MNKQAIILAGGLGTRLRSAVPDLPKCMAPVAGKPFLYHVIAYLLRAGVDSFIFSLGYKHEVIEDFIKANYPNLDTRFCIEDEPLGTGGAIRLACKQATQKNVLVLNGDTMYKINAGRLLEFHEKHHAACTLALKPMHQFDRYGVVEINFENNIQSFREKQYYDHGLINGGVYALNVEKFLAIDMPEKFSFEKDYLEKYFATEKMMGLQDDAYFIDIGIPEDFARANEEFKRSSDIPLQQIDHSWTLFLDRDGVINHEKHKDYVHTWSEFVFYDGVKEAIKAFASIFHRIIIVTNQKGVGKGLTKLEDLHTIHANMKHEIEAAGGRIDAVFYCSDLEETSPFRKPNPGMGLQAVQQFPDIDLSKAIMVGNTISDMEFGRNLGVYTVFLPTTRPEVDWNDHRIDMVSESLLDFSNQLKSR